MKNLNKYINEAWGGVKKSTNNAEIEAWCKVNNIENYTINSKGEIDVDGEVFIDSKNFNDIELPYKFGKVNGNFKLYIITKLTSLKNCPDIVTNDFSCMGCSQLDSLEGCPKEVGRDFYWFRNKKRFKESTIRSFCNVKRGVEL